jgi:hypothetical protein
MKTLTERTTATLAWIDAQLAICNAATEGPWEHSGGNGIHKMISRTYGTCIATTDGEQRKPNAAFIAAARTGYPAMLEGMKMQLVNLRPHITDDESMTVMTPEHSLCCFCNSQAEQILTSIEQLQ